MSKKATYGIAMKCKYLCLIGLVASDSQIVCWQVLVNNTYKAIETKDTRKFLAEGQPNYSRRGHLWAVFKHRCGIYLDPYHIGHTVYS